MKGDFVKTNAPPQRSLAEIKKTVDGIHLHSMVCMYELTIRCVLIAGFKTRLTPWIEK